MACPLGARSSRNAPSDTMENAPLQPTAALLLPRLSHRPAGNVLLDATFTPICRTSISTGGRARTDTVLSHHRILSPARLPIPPLRRGTATLYQCTKPLRPRGGARLTTGSMNTHNAGRKMSLRCITGVVQPVVRLQGGNLRRVNLAIGLIALGVVAALLAGCGGGGDQGGGGGGGAQTVK